MSSFSVSTVPTNDLAPICTTKPSDTVITKFRTLRCPDSKVHGVNMGPIWGRQDPGGPHVGPMNFAIWVGPALEMLTHILSSLWHIFLCSTFIFVFISTFLIAKINIDWTSIRHESVGSISSWCWFKDPCYLCLVYKLVSIALAASWHSAVQCSITSASTGVLSNGLPCINMAEMGDCWLHCMPTPS